MVVRFSCHSANSVALSGHHLPCPALCPRIYIISLLFLRDSFIAFHGPVCHSNTLITLAWHLYFSGDSANAMVILTIPAWSRLYVRYHPGRNVPVWIHLRACNGEVSRFSSAWLISRIMLTHAPFYLCTHHTCNSEQDSWVINSIQTFLFSCQHLHQLIQVLNYK